MLANCAGAATAPVADAARASVTIYAAGDIADCRHRPPAWSGAAATAELVAAALARAPDGTVLTLGDATYPRGAAAEFSDCYAPTWGRFKQATRPAPGNHEYASAGAAPYFDYFGAAAAPARGGYYSFELGAWHLVALNSMLTAQARTRQLEWLRADLAAHRQRCTLAYWHHPLYSSGGHAPDARMRAAWQVLYEAGADVVLSGHDHDYERFAPQDANGRVDTARGLRQFVVGTGGAYATPFVRALANSEARDSARSGVLRLQLGQDGYAWDFMEASYDGFPNGAPPDHGQARCHARQGA